MAYDQYRLKPTHRKMDYKLLFEKDEEGKEGKEGTLICRFSDFWEEVIYLDEIQWLLKRKSLYFTGDGEDGTKLKAVVQDDDLVWNWLDPSMIRISYTSYI